jgi:uncharacterized protein (TIGR02231 family)
MNIKKLSIFPLLLFMSFHISANGELITVNGQLDKVLLYTSGATFTESISIPLKAGANQIEFTGISSKLDEKRILLYSSANAKVVSLTHKVRSLDFLLMNAAYKNLIDSLTLLRHQTEALNKDKENYALERDMLVKNMYIGGQNNGVLVLELQKASDFYRSKLAEISKLQLALELQREKTSEIYTKLTGRKVYMESEFRKTNGIIQAVVMAKAAGIENFELNYFVKNCGWAPFYDVKIEDASKPIHLVYHSKLYNNTGTNWNNIQLVISTASPEVSVEPPTLDTWYLSFEGAYDRWGNSKNKALLNSYSPWTNKANMYVYDSVSALTTMGEKIILVSPLSVDFEIPEKKTIPADGQPYLIEMKNYDLKSDYHYIAIPKLDKQAFLLAGITDWEQLNLVEGAANIYMGKTYIGQSYINPNQTDDTLDISLGRDPKVVLNYERKKDKTSRSFFGGATLATFSFEITVKNNNLKDIQLDLYDQIPLSNIPEITVEPAEISQADLDKDKGKLSWNILVKSGESAKYLVSYTVKYPRNKRVKVQVSRLGMMRCPDF